MGLFAALSPRHLSNPSTSLPSLDLCGALSTTDCSSTSPSSLTRVYSFVPASPRLIGFPEQKAMAYNFTLSSGHFAGAAVAFLTVWLVLRAFGSPESRFPVLNKKGRFELSGARVRKEYNENSWSMMQQGIKTFDGGPFRISSADRGEIVVLPPRFGPKIRNDRRLSLSSLVAKWNLSHFEEFDIFSLGNSPTQIMQSVFRKDLTQSTGRFMLPLSQECDYAIPRLFPTSTEGWTTVTVLPTAFQLVSRLDLLVYLGRDSARSDAFTNDVCNFVMQARPALIALRAWPSFLHRILRLFLPQCQKFIATRRRVIGMINAANESKGERPTQASDEQSTHFRSWYDRQQRQLGGKYEPATAQLLAFAAISNTSDLLAKVIIDLAEHPELIGPLRNEIMSVIPTMGWRKIAIYKLFLLDSVLKETQRLKPVQVGFMEREVLQNLTITDPETKDPIHFKRGGTIMISPGQMREPSVYRDPENYDGYRFYRLRFDEGEDPYADAQKPGPPDPRLAGDVGDKDATDRRSSHQLTSLSNDHLGFGLGEHACPGRFHVASEVKIALCHLIMKYDWKLVDGKPRSVQFGNAFLSDPAGKVAFRRRKETYPWLEGDGIQATLAAAVATAA
ncbi:trichothecene c-8 hydroxylase [Colletotrichum incanum]|uniref:Trichothecene c-8 hydroxylase n=1 Tax=Colletotrichum incanum TaxID=1573173 RepID=A0A161XWJ3_COLIC|nr:trichothecene c-8 hydroxylase [Colletotrichum incanum]